MSISAQLGIPTSTVSDIIKKYKETGSAEPKQCSGQPKLLSECDTRALKHLESALKNLDSKVDLMRTELGNIYEISAHLEIANISNSHYSFKFEISDLNGLVQLSLPRKKFSNENPKYNSQIYIQVYCVDKLANHIYKLEESISYIHSLSKNNNFIKNLNTLVDNAVKALDAWKAYEKNIDINIDIKVDVEVNIEVEVDIDINIDINIDIEPSIFNFK
ncbi:hypothetical protein C1645_829535 [Glomus cerebriforme]|uniref:Uncharacterized protein n=1 Tax=Glomus cerebriforme TaxID=658196 RepID=A0A397SJS0_9GLOM|nr:hypothetical protein C1645_829535 [Glomus cerebriforme]